jgi:hypothetical protein
MARRRRPNSSGRTWTSIRPQLQNSQPTRAITGTTAPLSEPIRPDSTILGDAWQKAVVRPSRLDVKPFAQGAGVLSVTGCLMLSGYPIVGIVLFCVASAIYSVVLLVALFGAPEISRRAFRLEADRPGRNHVPCRGRPKSRYAAARAITARYHFCRPHLRAACATPSGPPTVVAAWDPAVSAGVLTQHNDRSSAALTACRPTRTCRQIGGYLRVCVAMLITEGSPRRPITENPAGHS